MIVLVKMTGGDDYMSAVFSAVKLESPVIGRYVVL